MSTVRKLFNSRGEHACAGAVDSKTVKLEVAIREDRVYRAIDGAVVGEFHMTKDMAMGLICQIADAAGVIVEVSADRESWGQRLRRQRREVTVKRLNLKPGEHDLYATGDEGIPECARDGNGEVTLGICRNCGRGESELDDEPVCDHRLVPAAADGRLRPSTTEASELVGVFRGEPVYVGPILAGLAGVSPKPIIIAMTAAGGLADGHERAVTIPSAAAESPLPPFSQECKLAPGWSALANTLGVDADQLHADVTAPLVGLVKVGGP